MFKFYILLWMRWLIHLSLMTFLYGAIFALFILLFTYAKEGYPTLNSDVKSALFEIWYFWFLIVSNIALLLALFQSLKYIFNKCINGYKLELFTCVKKEKQEVLESIGYGDIVRVWRKWLMSIIWLSSVQMILLVVLNLVFNSENSLLSWFNSYTLYVFILISGFFSLLLINAKCKLTRVSRC